MEADHAGAVYRVSHVVDGEFVSLLRRNHTDPYYFAARSLDSRGLTPISATGMMIEAFLAMPDCAFARKKTRNEKQQAKKSSGCRLPFD
jgi:hypothetical protein